MAIPNLYRLNKYVGYSVVDFVVLLVFEFGVFVFVLWDRDLLCSPDWPLPHNPSVLAFLIYFFLVNFVYMYNCFVCVYVYAPRTCLGPEKDRKHWIPWLELQIVMSSHVGAESQTWVLCKSSQLLSPLSSPCLRLLSTALCSVFFEMNFCKPHQKECTPFASPKNLKFHRSYRVDRLCFSCFLSLCFAF